MRISNAVPEIFSLVEVRENAYIYNPSGGIPAPEQSLTTLNPLRKSKMTYNVNQADLHFWTEQPGVARQVSVVIGGDGRDEAVPGTGLTLLELEHRQAEGRRLQARAARASFAALGRWRAALPRTLTAAYRRYRDTQRAIRHLSELPNYLLKDMGISRGEIRYVATSGRDPGHKASTQASTEVAVETQVATVASNDAEPREAA
jgi:uncharacterized protein YjiS (DUF1127 family)